MASILQQQWAEGCINVDIDIREPGLYYDTSNEINYCDVELGITGWGSRPVPQLFMLEAYVSSAIDEGCLSGFNESRWSDPEIDELTAEAGLTADPDARAAIYSQIAAIFNERGPIIVPYFANMIGVASDRVQGLEMAPFPGLTDYRTVSLAG
jgi:peptide/nickel transport system substrate-binding protein